MRRQCRLFPNYPNGMAALPEVCNPQGMKNLLVLLALLISTTAVAEPVTRAKLLEGCEIPERREFPISETVSPCDDFYEYACSKVNSSFHLRDDRSSHTYSFNDSYERMLHAKKRFLKLLQETTPSTARSTALKNVYAACMNE